MLVSLIQSQMSEMYGAGVNDLEDGDAGDLKDGDAGKGRKIRRKKVAMEGGAREVGRVGRSGRAE